MKEIILRYKVVSERTKRIEIEDADWAILETYCNNGEEYMEGERVHDELENFIREDINFSNQYYEENTLEIYCDEFHYQI